jgi:hypothetical protein
MALLDKIRGYFGGGSPVEKLSVAYSSSNPFTSRLVLSILPYYDPTHSVTETMRRAFKGMLKSPAVKAGLLTKVYAVASLDWQIQPANPHSPRDLEACDFLRFCVERLPSEMPGLIETLTIPRLIDGYQAAEKIRTIEKEDPRWRGKMVYEDIRAKPTDLYEPIVDEYARVIGIRGMRANYGEVYPIEDFVWTRHLPIYDNPIGNSDLVAAYQHYWMRDTVTKLRAIHAEKFTSPMMKGEAPPDKRSALAEALEAAKSRTWMVVPDGVKVEAMNLALRGEADFKSFIDDCDRQILISLTGAYLQHLEGQVADGRGSSKEGRSISELFQWTLAVAVQIAFNKQIAPELIRLNYAGVGVPRLVLGGLSEQEIAAILNNYVLLQNLNFAPSREEVSRRTSFATPKDDKDKLEKPAAPPLSPLPMPHKTDGPQTLPFVETFAEAGKQVALAGPDGAAAARLLDRSKEEGAKFLYYLTRRAVQRVVDSPNPQAVKHLFDDSELTALADQLAKTNATANLLGRARIHERASQAELSKAGILKFTDADAFSCFADAPPPMAPQAAVEYFKGLVPSMDVKAQSFAPAVRREAFTLAIGTDQKMLEQVKQAVLEGIVSGKDGTPAVEAILERVGVTPDNPQYSQMIFRTNAMDAYNQGVQDELQTPEMQEFFPVWQYVGIRDGRQGKDHEPHFDRYYSNARTFAEIRGPRPFNCRCTMVPVDKYTADELKANGVRIES